MAHITAMLVWCLYLLIKPTRAEICESDIDHLLIKEHELSGYTLWETKTKDAIDCARSCIRGGADCKSFNYNTTTRMCQLNSISGSPSKTDTSVVYSDIADWPTQVDPDCYNRPCGDDETCIPGGLTGGTSCSYSCFKKVRRCPVPEGTVSSEPRTIGSIYTYTCDPRLVGRDSALCLPTGQWNKTMDTSCKPRFGSSCDGDDYCSPINGNCTDGVCGCSEGQVYDSQELACVRDCGPNWIRFEDKCYLFVTTKYTNENAKVKPDTQVKEMDSINKEICADKESRLVVVETMAENEFLKRKMMALYAVSTDYYWSGLYRVAAGQTQWYWSTNDGNMDPTFFDWENTEPNNVNEVCVVIFFANNSTFRWADLPCNVLGRPVCEK